MALGQEVSWIVFVNESGYHGSGRVGVYDHQLRYWGGQGGDQE